VLELCIAPSTVNRAEVRVVAAFCMKRVPTLNDMHPGILVSRGFATHKTLRRLVVGHMNELEGIGRQHEGGSAMNAW